MKVNYNLSMLSSPFTVNPPNKCHVNSWNQMKFYQIFYHYKKIKNNRHLSTFAFPISVRTCTLHWSSTFHFLTLHKYHVKEQSPSLIYVKAAFWGWLSNYQEFSRHNTSVMVKCPSICPPRESPCHIWVGLIIGLPRTPLPPSTIIWMHFPR